MRRKVVLVATIAAFAILVSPAGAVITSSQVTTPTDPTFLDPDLDAASQPFTVSGTATGTGAVDIFCAINNGNAAADGPTPLANDVPVAGGGFSTTVDLNDFSYFICRLIAVDSADTLPFEINTFRGPVVGNGGHELSVVSGGPNDGLIQSYLQQSSTLGGYWSAESAGGCYLYDSFPIDPATLNYAGAMWFCSFIEQGEDPTEPSLRVDSRNAYLPDNADEDFAGFRGIENLTHGIEPTNGRMRNSDTERAVICVPDEATCTSYADSGLKLDQKQTGGTGGNTLTVNHHWVNTTKSTKQLEVFYGIQTDDGSPGWRFPGESVYSARATDDTVTPPQTGPASFFAAYAPGSTCPSLSDPCGSVTWYEPPESIRFASDDLVFLGYTRSIPPGATEVIALTYSHGFPQSAVDGYAADAEAGFDTTFSFGKLKKNTKKGKATLAVRVPGEGELHLEGKGLKTVNKNARASAAGRAHARATSTVKLLIKPKGKARKKLKRKGKAKFKASVTYTRTDLEPVEDSKKLKLKQKPKK